MKELKPHEGWDWKVWFWVDKEEFEGGWKTGQCRYRVQKAVGRDTDGKLFLMSWTNLDTYNWRNFKQRFYEINFDEYASLLQRAIRQGEVKPQEKDRFLAKAKSPFVPPWDIHKDIVVYRDERYVLGQQDGRPYLMADGRKWILSCHPYEPCLYIDNGNGAKTTVHNAFDPFVVLESFHNGQSVVSITGREYSPQDFCRMVACACGRIDVSINEAERCLETGGRDHGIHPSDKRKP